MAEALTLVGLAGNIVQFLDAAGKIVSFAQELYKGGSLNVNDEIEKTTRALQESLTLIDFDKVHKDARLQALISACMVLTDDMTELLEGLKVTKKRNQLMEVTSKSFKMIRERGKMKDLERRLGNLRDGICSYLTVILKYGDAVFVSNKD